MIQSLGNPPSIALIGVSGYAEVYIDWLVEAHARGVVRLVAATILPHERQLAPARSILEFVTAVYDSYDIMFAAEAGKLDICFIPTGIQWHARMTIAALESGSNVLVEKPLAGSISDVERVQEAERRCGKWVAVGFQDMYTNDILELKQSLLDGRIGKLCSVSMIGAWPRPKSYYTRNQWAGKLTVDGNSVLDSPLNNAFAHFVNLSLFLAGNSSAESVKATVVNSELYHAHAIESFDTAVVQATAENGVALWFGVTHATADTIEPRIKIVGERGTIVWEHEKDCTLYAEGQGALSKPVPRYGQTRQKMFERVIKRLEDPTVRICDISIAKSHTHLIENLHENAVIKSFPPNSIEMIANGPANSEIPAIKDIAARLENAFRRNSSLGDLTAASA